MKKCQNPSCEETSFPHKNSKYCSTKCTVEHRTQKHIDQSIKKYPDGSDYATCAICGFRAKNLQVHVQTVHNTKASEYRDRYKTHTLSPKKLDQASNNWTGKNNPGFAHGGLMSPWSDKSGRCPEDIESSKAKAKEDRYTPTQLEYWVRLGYSNEEAAILRKERQTTFSLEKCICELGDVAGTQRWNDRQEKWLKSFPRLNYSKISQELYWGIYELLDDKDVQFAQLLNGTKDETGKNHEMQVCTSLGTFVVDFVQYNKIIEFDGDYWHSEAKVNPERESRRAAGLTEQGYIVRRVREQDYKKNKQKVIQECLDFLKGD